MDNIQSASYWRNRSFHDEKKDWEDNSQWIDGYWNSRNHPHRKLLINAIKELGTFDKLLEVGCSCGPNLANIVSELQVKPESLFGIDVNVDSIGLAKKMLLDCNFKVGTVRKIPFEDKTFDITVSDAVLMYVARSNIYSVLKELVRVTKKYLVLVEWFDDSTPGTIKDFHWAYNYPKLLGRKGAVVEYVRKLTLEDWPTETWARNGYISVFRLQ